MSNTEKTLILLVSDLAFIFLGMVFSLFPFTPGTDFLGHAQAMTLIAPLWILMYFTEGLYTLKTHNPADLPIALIRATATASFLSFALMYFAPRDLHDLNSGSRLLVIGLIVPYMIFEARRFFFSFLSTESRLRKTVLIGSLPTLNIAREEIGKKPYLGYKIIREVVPTATEHFSIPPETQLIAIERRIIEDRELYQKVFNLLGSGIDIMDLAKFTEKISGKIPVSSIDPTWFVDYCGVQNSFSYELQKGLLDRFVATLLLILLVPVALVLIPILLIFHGRPIFFKQQRVGLNNKTFTLYKLRTMVVNAEKNGAQWAKPGDARVTKIGSFLRKTRLDELPQLINIFKGDMSLVGPRPERPEIIRDQLSPQIPFYNLRHLVKPGVTGWAQVTFRYGFTIEDSKEKLQFDLFYVKNRSLWLDILVIIKTIKTVITGAGQ